jgi:hypothetical protein
MDDRHRAHAIEVGRRGFIHLGIPERDQAHHAIPYDDIVHQAHRTGLLHDERQNRQGEHGRILQRQNG